MNKVLLLCIFYCSVFCQNTDNKMGMSAKRLQRLQDTMSNYIEKNQISGMTAMIARHGKIVHFAHHGFATLKGEAIKDDTIFRIYSMSKLVTSVAVMMLYEESHFRLYDPISKHIPEFKNLKVFVEKTADGIKLEDAKREPTIRDLLTHTAGFSYGYFGQTEVDKMYLRKKVLDRNKSLKEMIQALSTIPLKNQPGSKWEYSLSIDILGYLVEVISGQKFDEFLQERIFEPLKMKDTGFHVPKEKLHRFTTLYLAKNKKMHVFDPVNGQFSKPPKLFSGGGGLVSTAKDYMNFCTMILQKGRFENTNILGRKTVEFMMQNQLDPKLLPFGTGYKIWGYGFGIGGAILQNPAQAQTIMSKGSLHWSGAATTFFTIDPKENLIALFFTQSWPHSGKIGNKFRTLVYGAIIE